MSKGESFTIVYKCGCVLLYLEDKNDIGPSALMIMSTLVGLKSSVDARLSEITGAEIVSGTKRNLELLREDPEIRNKAEEAVAEALQASRISAFNADFKQWLLFGRRTPYTDTMLYGLTGIKFSQEAADNPAVPKTPKALIPCLRMTDTMPELVRMPDCLDGLSQLSKEWGVLAGAWDQINDALEEDHPGWREPKAKKGRPKQRSAGKCEALIQELLG